MIKVKLLIYLARYIDALLRVGVTWITLLLVFFMFNIVDNMLDYDLIGDDLFDTHLAHIATFMLVISLLWHFSRLVCRESVRFYKDIVELENESKDVK